MAHRRARPSGRGAVFVWCIGVCSRPPRRAVGGPGDEDAITTLLEAGAEAAHRAPTAAARCYQAALRLMPQSPDARPRRLEVLTVLARPSRRRADSRTAAPCWSTPSIWCRVTRPPCGCGSTRAARASSSYWGCTPTLAIGSNGRSRNSPIPSPSRRPRCKLSSPSPRSTRLTSPPLASTLDRHSTWPASWRHALWKRVRRLCLLAPSHRSCPRIRHCPPSHTGPPCSTT